MIQSNSQIIIKTTNVKFEKKCVMIGLNFVNIQATYKMKLNLKLIYSQIWGQMSVLFELSVRKTAEKEIWEPLSDVKKNGQDLATD